MCVQMRKEVALKKSRRKPSAAAFAENPTGGEFCPRPLLLLLVCNVLIVVTMPQRIFTWLAWFGWLWRADLTAIVFHTERSQLRGLNVVHRELGSTSRTVSVLRHGSGFIIAVRVFVPGWLCSCMITNAILRVLQANEANLHPRPTPSLGVGSRFANVLWGCHDACTREFVPILPWNRDTKYFL